MTRFDCRSTVASMKFFLHGNATFVFFSRSFSVFFFRSRDKMMTAKPVAVINKEEAEGLTCVFVFRIIIYGRNSVFFFFVALKNTLPLIQSADV